MQETLKGTSNLSRHFQNEKYEKILYAQKFNSTSAHMFETIFGCMKRHVRSQDMLKAYAWYLKKQSYGISWEITMKRSQKMQKAHKHDQEHMVHTGYIVVGTYLMVLKHRSVSRQVTMPNHAIELKVAPKAAETKAVKTSVKEGPLISWHEPLNPDWFIDSLRNPKNNGWFINPILIG